jgi:hypothetical protein
MTRTDLSEHVKFWQDKKAMFTTVVTTEDSFSVSDKVLKN